MDTNTVLLVICAVLTGIWIVYTRMLHNIISEMRLDLHELYFLTREQIGARGEGIVFTDVQEVHRAYESRTVDLHARGAF